MIFIFLFAFIFNWQQIYRCLCMKSSYNYAYDRFQYIPYRHLNAYVKFPTSALYFFGLCEPFTSGSIRWFEKRLGLVTTVHSI